MYADIGLAKDQRNLWFNVMLMSNGNGNAMVMTHGHGHGSNDRSFNDTCMMDMKVWGVTADDTARHNKCSNPFNKNILEHLLCRAVSSAVTPHTFLSIMQVSLNIYIYIYIYI